MSKIKAGAEVYNTDGIAALYVGKSPDYGLIVTAGLASTASIFVTVDPVHVVHARGST